MLLILPYLPSLLCGIHVDDAEIGLGEIERRLAKIAGPLRGEARIWRDLAAKALGKA